MKPATDFHKKHSSHGPQTLSIDIGGSSVKGSVLDAIGRMVAERVYIDTPYPFKPKTLIETMAKIAETLPTFDRISIGFPGVVRNNQIITAPHFGTSVWHGFALGREAAKHFGKPVRVLNDAEVHGLGIVSGRGLEVVLTLGTGVGSAVFTNGVAGPHLELAHHPIHKNNTYNEYVGDTARRSIGIKNWSRRVLKMIGIVDTLLNYDTLYIGGGNATRIVGDLPSNVQRRSNDAGITGGVHLWRDPLSRTGR